MEMFVHFMTGWIKLDIFIQSFSEMLSWKCDQMENHA